MRKNALAGKKYAIVGDNWNILRMFSSMGGTMSRNILAEDLDFVVFRGGLDVTPSLYGEKNVKSYSRPERDNIEKIAFESLKERKIPMVGICRGSQFLNVMHGGKLWQDVSGHTMEVNETHPIIEVGTNKRLHVTSTHHQMMRPTDDAKLIAYAESRSDYYISDSETRRKAIDKEPEVLVYEETNTLCFQGHPEFLSCPVPTEDWFIELIKNHCLKEK